MLGELRGSQLHRKTGPAKPAPGITGGELDRRLLRLGGAALALRLVGGAQGFGFRLGLGFCLALGFVELRRGQRLEAHGQLLDQVAPHLAAQLRGFLVGTDQVVSSCT